jgi:hypothetical protein
MGSRQASFYRRILGSLRLSGRDPHPHEQRYVHQCRFSHMILSCCLNLLSSANTDAGGCRIRRFLGNYDSGMKRQARDPEDVMRSRLLARSETNLRQ